MSEEDSVAIPTLDMEVVGPYGPLCGAFTALLKDFYSGRRPEPRRLFDQIAKRVPRFRGYQQQDAQELLVYLLDGMRDEEIQSIRSSLKSDGEPDGSEISPQMIRGEPYRSIRSVCNDCVNKHSLIIQHSATAQRFPSLMHAVEGSCR